MSFDRLAYGLFLIALVFLAFVGGAVSLHYEWPVARPVKEAIDAGEAWYESRTAADESEDAVANNIRSVDQSIEQARVDWNQDKAYPGYTLFALRYSTSVYLIDMEGRIMHRWDLPFKKAFPHPRHVHALAKAIIGIEKAQVFPNGDVLVTYTGTRDTPYGYGMAKFNKDSELLWAYAANVHHGFYVDRANGDIHTLTQEFIRRPVAKLPYLTLPVLADYIVTLSPEGEERNRISLLDAFADSPYASMLYHKRINRQDWDRFHTNAVETLEPDIAPAFPMFKPGYLLISLRNMCALAVIDPASGKVVWAYNGLWQGQHAAHFLANGHFLLLDNFGYYAAGRPFSRVVEFDPRSLQIVWQFAGNPKQKFYTYAYGRTQRLPNGNTLVAETLNSRIFEITPAQDIVWSFKLSPFYRKIDPALPPYGRKAARELAHNPVLAELLKTTPNLSNAIIDAQRYPAQAVPFLSAH